MDAGGEQPTRPGDNSAPPSVTLTIDPSGFEELSSDFYWTLYMRKRFDEENVSLMDLAVMTRADLPSIKSLHEIHNKEITGDILGIACTYGASPGVIPYLVTQAPAAAQYMGVWKDDNFSASRRLRAPAPLRGGLSATGSTS